MALSINQQLLGGLAAVMTLRHVFNVSPLFVLLCLGLFLCFASGGRGPPGREEVQPVHETGLLDGLQWGVSAIQGRRPYMEDMHQVSGLSSTCGAAGLTHFFAVYDGHGGKRAAAWARGHLLPKLQAYIVSAVERNGGAQLGEDDVARACVDAWLATDGEFVKHAVQNAIPDGSTGICCILLRPATPGGRRRLMVVNVGDSRAAMVHAEGSARPLSEDHKPNRPDERARVEAAGGHVIFAGCWRVQGDLAVSRAFGDCHLKRYGVTAEPEIKTYELGPSDAFLVLASDGLWDVVDEQQCAKVVLRAPDAITAASALCDLASVRGSMDNITSLVVDVRQLS